MKLQEWSRRAVRHGVNGASSEALGRVALELCSRPPEVEEGTGAVGPAGSDCERRGAAKTVGLDQVPLGPVGKFRAVR